VAPSDEPEALLLAYRERRAAFEAARKAQDEQVAALLPRYVAALLREHAGLNVVLLSAYMDYDSSQRTGQAWVENDGDLEHVWGEALSDHGECPTNQLGDGVASDLREQLMRFWPSLQRLRGDLWVLALRRPERPDQPPIELTGHFRGWD
jgi:hypothetical protein